MKNLQIILNQAEYHFNYLDIEYKIQQGKHCFEHAYQPTYSKDDAFKKCTFDDSCAGVYDNYCDDSPPFYLCPKRNADPFVFEESTLKPQSCVHMKQGNFVLQKIT